TAAGTAPTPPPTHWPGCSPGRGPARRGSAPWQTSWCSPTRSPPTPHRANGCTPPAPRTSECGCATAPGSSGRAVPPAAPRAASACVTATAGLATAQALVALGGPDTAAGPPVLDATLELDVDAGTITRRAWTPHPDCRCGAGWSRGTRPELLVCEDGPARET